MKIETKTNCPLNKFKPCKGLECAWFTQVRGTNPQTGEEIDEWGCAMTWLPLLLIDNTQQARQHGAAIESFRNAVVYQMTSQLENSKLLPETHLQNGSQNNVVEKKIVEHWTPSLPPESSNTQ